MICPINHQMNQKPLIKFSFALCSAIWINLVGLVVLLSICAYGGMVIFAKYADCDPLTAKVKQILLLPIFIYCNI